MVPLGCWLTLLLLLPVQVERLEKSEFPNGCCCGNHFPQDREAGQKWVLWHAACGGDLHSKHQHLTKILEASKNVGWQTSDASKA